MLAGLLLASHYESPEHKESYEFGSRPPSRQHLDVYPEDDRSRKTRWKVERVSHMDINTSQSLAQVARKSGEMLVLSTLR